VTEKSDAACYRREAVRKRSSVTVEIEAIAFRLDDLKALANTYSRGMASGMAGQESSQAGLLRLCLVKFNRTLDKLLITYGYECSQDVTMFK
jgi:hypothetical protein